MTLPHLISEIHARIFFFKVSTDPAIMSDDFIQAAADFIRRVELSSMSI